MKENEVQITDGYNTHEFKNVTGVKYYIKHGVAYVYYEGFKTVIANVEDMTCGQRVELEIVTL